MSELLKIDPYAYTYWQNREKPQNVKMALASRELAKYAAISIDPKTKMCCSAYRTADSAAYYSFGSGLRTEPEKCQENYKKYPHLAEELKSIYGLLRQDDSGCVLERSRDDCQNRLAEAGACWGGGGQQLSINVLSSEELLDAQLHPEQYADLIVRVGGFSAYFVTLEKGLQDNIIARTNYT